jgi:hypothetical protein
MYMLIAAALVISLMITAAPAQKVSGACTADVCAEWERVNTPTMDDFVLAPGSSIIDYAVAEDGDVAYAIIYGQAEDLNGDEYRLLKSTDGAATWTDLSKAVKKEIREVLDLADDAYVYPWLMQVACDLEDSDFVAIALEFELGSVHVFISADGGTTFIDADEVEDDGADFYYDDSRGYGVFDLEVSPELDGEHDIAIAGTNYYYNAARIFRCEVSDDDPGKWVDATDANYDGWDNINDDIGPNDFYSEAVVDVQFSPNWGTDRTILAVTVTGYTLYGTTEWAPPGDVYLQTGTWVENDGGWNKKSNAAIEAVLIEDDLRIPPLEGMVAGIVLPEDYSGKSASTRVLWVWVNYVEYVSPWFQDDNQFATIYKVDDDDKEDVGPKGQIEDGEVWLANISYLGTIAEGKAIAGLIGKGAITDDGDFALSADCCAGVQVYRNDNIMNMEICCYGWDDACKPPTGVDAMAAFYVSEEKAYAVALELGTLSYNFDFLLADPYYDEGAWSVSFDDGDIWNQLSLVDTFIDYLSDVAVSPDCNKTFLVSVNLQSGCGCDSVWLKADNLPEAEEYSDHWLRTWCGHLTGYNDDHFGGHLERGFLRLAPEELTGADVVTVYLVDRMTDTVYYNDLETLACWTPGTASVGYIVDLAVKDESTIYALDYLGEVAMSDDHGAALTWTDPVDTAVEYGWSIAVHTNNVTHVLVGGQNGDCDYSADGGEEDTWVAEEDREYPAATGLVTVAFDTYFDDNEVIYAALALAGSDNGIYLWDFGDATEKWHKLRAYNGYDYTGIVLDRPSPSNPMTSSETGGVLYASFVGYHCDDFCCDGIYYEGECDGACWYTGVARCLTPITEICCDVGEADWDYLTVGLIEEYDPKYPMEHFIMGPDALKICGCLEKTTNSKLFAIGVSSNGYDMDEGQYGTVWTFEDCYAKQDVKLLAPVDKKVIDANPCECYNNPFSVKWERLCDACCYEIQIAMDDKFTDIWDTWYVAPEAPLNPSYWMGQNSFTCEFTYYWRVRAYHAETGQPIHSWWSKEGRSFTIAPSVGAAAIDLVSPVPGATGVATKSVGFSWDLLATADEFKWVLDDTADLSSPLETKPELTTKACTYTGTLSYGTTYYWQVTAYKGDAAISTSAVGTFTTAPTGAFCCPQCGLCFDTQQALKDHIAAEHPAQPATPTWVWVVIAIGAVLVIVVIVLIFRTRRV